MHSDDPLEASLLDLHALLADRMPLIVGGGYGLFLKQNALSRAAVPTRFTADRLPDNRTTVVSIVETFVRCPTVIPVLDSCV